MFFSVLFIIGCVTAIFSSAEMTSIIKKPFLYSDTIRSLKVISYYHSGYFVSAAIFIGFFLSFLCSKLPISDFFGFLASTWNTIGVFITRLEKNEYTYQCHFGLSFQTVRCEIYGNINRMFLLGCYQGLKYMQESFSYSDFNLFRILGFFFTLNGVIRKVVKNVRPYRMMKKTANNVIVIGSVIVQAMYTLHNWREIVQGMSLDVSIKAVGNDGDEFSEEDEGERKEAIVESYRSLPWLTISKG